MNTRKWHKFMDILIILTLTVSVGIFILMPFFYILKEAFIYKGTFNIAELGKIIVNNTKLLFNTLKLSILTASLTVIVSSCVAIYLYIEKEFIRNKLILFLMLTMISPPFVSALSYINLFGRRGLISYRLLHLSIQPYGMWGIVFMQLLSEFSLASLLIYGVLKNIPRYMIDSAKSLGARTNDIIKDILIPNMSSGIKAAFILSFLKSISDFGTPAIIGGKFNVLATESYFAVIAEGNLHKAASLNILMFIPALLVFIFYQKSLKNMQTATHGISSGESDVKRNGCIYCFIKILALFFILWIGLQYASLILSAFTSMKRGNMIVSLKNIKESLVYLDESLLRSITYSFISAVFGSIIGLMIAYYMQIRKLRIAKFLDMTASFPYIIPGTFFGLGYILSFNKPPLLLVGTSAIVVLNVLFKQLPFSTKMGNSAMEMIDMEALSAVRDLGGSRIDELKDLVLPLSKDYLFMSFANAFTTTMTTIGSIIFLVYPGQKVLTLVMFDAIQSGKYGVGSVLALVIMVVCVGVNVVVRKLAT